MTYAKIFQVLDGLTLAEIEALFARRSQASARMQLQNIVFRSMGREYPGVEGAVFYEVEDL